MICGAFAQRWWIEAARIFRTFGIEKMDAPAADAFREAEKPAEKQRAALFLSSLSGPEGAWTAHTKRRAQERPSGQRTRPRFQALRQNPRASR